MKKLTDTQINAIFAFVFAAFAIALMLWPQTVKTQNVNPTVNIGNPGALPSPNPPAPTISPYLGVTEAAPSTAPAVVNGNYEGVIDVNGSRATYVCGRAAANCANTIRGANNNGIGAISLGVPTELSATVGTCTNLNTTNPTAIYQLFVNGTAQTGVLSFFNASVCTGTAFLVIPTASMTANATIQINVYCSPACSYQWTTAAEQGHVFLMVL